MRTSTTGRSSERGFTLIELVVVIAVIGVVFALAVPTTRDAITVDDLKKATRRIVGLERQLRVDAVRDGIDQILCLDVRQSLYWVESADMTPEKVDEVKKKARGLGTGVSVADIVTGKNEKIKDGLVRLRFSKNHVCPPFVLHLAEGERFMTITVNPFLGVTGVYDRYADISLDDGLGYDPTK